MKFSLDVDLAEVTGDPAKEIVRILRYWANQLEIDDVQPGRACNIYDSAFSKVGRWEINEADDQDVADEA